MTLATPRSIRAALRRAFLDSRGQSLAMTAIVLGLLFSIMGLVFDGGQMYFERRRMQTAADAGAIGGALELWRGNSNLAEAAVLNDAALNGFDSSADDVTVTVHCPPDTGPNIGFGGVCNDAVEVIITRDLPTYFMRVAGVNSMRVRTRAVAGLRRYSDACVIALDESARGALTVSGGASLNAACGIMVNSTHNSSIVVNGGGCLQASQIGTAGNVSVNGSLSCVDPPPMRAPPMLDPLAYLTEPTIAGASAEGVYTDIRVNAGDNVALGPGYYPGGIDISGGAVQFLPGTYVLDTGFTVTGNASLSGAGVTFFNTNSGSGVGPERWGDFTIAGGVSVDLSAPSSGPYAGVLFWNDDAAPNSPPGSTITGNSSSSMTGAMYFPSSHLNFLGNSTTGDWQMLIADTITIGGNAQVSSNFGQSSIPAPSRKAVLIE